MKSFREPLGNVENASGLISIFCSLSKRHSPNGAKEISQPQCGWNRPYNPIRPEGTADNPPPLKSEISNLKYALGTLDLGL